MVRLVDLSFDLYDRAPTFWTDPKTAVIEHYRTENLGYNITQLVMSTHTGTHLDAPFHFLDDGLTVDRLDLRRGFGPAWVLDFSSKAPKEEISVAELEAHGEKIRAGSRLIFRTGWDRVFPEPRYFSDMPALSVDACRYLAERRVACVAMDTPSVNSSDYITAHHLLLAKEAEILIVEGLRGLERLQGNRVILVALPLRIRGRDGSPCRAIALDGDIGALGQLLEELRFTIDD
jgi:kynurenine formamidase